MRTFMRKTPPATPAAKKISLNPRNAMRKKATTSATELPVDFWGKEAVMLPEIEHPLEELRQLRKEIRFSENETQSMIEESKKIWSAGKVLSEGEKEMLLQRCYPFGNSHFDRL